MDMEQIHRNQREYFAAGATLCWEYRSRMLKKLREEIKSREQEIREGLYRDLGKSGTEAYACEIGMVLEEISFMLRKGKRFSRAHRAATPLAQFAARSYVKPAPYGCVLIMSPWNYPFLLTVGPLVDALAAGNTAVIKPSAYAPATAQVMEEIITACFPPEYAAVVQGGREENARLLDMKFDMVFFTGSQKVGREVLRHTAPNLIPAVLELGGKSPCVVDETAKIPLAARRIVFGKLTNARQTCVAPDYILCSREIKPKLTEAIVGEIKRQYGEHPLENPLYGRIVSRKHFDRLTALLQGENPVYGGVWDEQSLKIAPTVLHIADWKSPVMQEEIFGPVLPILTYEHLEEIPELLKDRAKPLAFYVFTENRHHARYLMERCAFGGGCINDTIIHLATPYMGFGGVGESGMGAYHGRAGFDAFSHRKSIVDKKTWVDLPIRYQPYSCRIKERLMRMFLR